MREICIQMPPAAITRDLINAGLGPANPVPPLPMLALHLYIIYWGLEKASKFVYEK
jgi:hypothetical protein